MKNNHFLSFEDLPLKGCQSKAGRAEDVTQ